jgi:hypothetical protein
MKIYTSESSKKSQYGAGEWVGVWLSDIKGQKKCGKGHIGVVQGGKYVIRALGESSM